MAFFNNESSSSSLSSGELFDACRLSSKASCRALSSDSDAVSSTSSCRLSLKAACISGSLSLDIEGPRSLGGPADVVITGLSVKVRSAGHSGNSPDTINIEYLWVFRVAYSFRKSLDNSFTRHFLTGPETGISMCLKLVQVVSRVSSSWTIAFRSSVL